MDSFWQCLATIRVTPMDDQTLIRQIFQRDAPKRLARLMNVPVETARNWLYRNLSSARRIELAEKMIEQIAEERRRLDAAERALKEITGGDK